LLQESDDHMVIQGQSCQSPTLAPSSEPR
jgi:hypothetical protein